MPIALDGSEIPELLKRSSLLFLIALLANIAPLVARYMVEADDSTAMVGQFEKAYLWAMPMASYGAMADAHKALGTNNHTVIIAENSAEQQQLVLTANQDTVYMSGVLDLRNGPMVMELPGGLLGTLNNIWQQPLTDLGDRKSVV